MRDGISSRFRRFEPVLHPCGVQAVADPGGAGANEAQILLFYVGIPSCDQKRVFKPPIVQEAFFHANFYSLLHYPNIPSTVHHSIQDQIPRLN